MPFVEGSNIRINDLLKVDRDDQPISEFYKKLHGVLKLCSIYFLIFLLGV
jgi:hypothetical protein